MSDEEAAQVDRLRYILANGCKERLVASPKDWPGVHMIRAVLDGEPLTGTWFDRTKEYTARLRGSLPPGLPFVRVEGARCHMSF